jgi:oligopeptide/dipeptide ABC transporter ATP-binding protein
VQKIDERKRQGVMAQSDLLQVSDLKMHFPIRKGVFKRVVGHTRAVDGVSFSVKEGETLGLVGESGSGKTTIGRCIVRLYDPTEGKISLRNNGSVIEITGLSGKRELREVRRDVQMLFQDPYSSLNPRMTVEDIVVEPLKVHSVGSKEERKEKAKELIRMVGLSEYQLNRYPHQFSGGQRQRIGIARALSLSPRLVICDEPVSALDVSVQAQVLNTLKELQSELGLTYLFIAHDLNVVDYISDRIIVVYLGRVMEFASADQLRESPKHPYTEALMGAIPKYQLHGHKRTILGGTIPDPSSPPSGCVFHTRCKYATDTCKKTVPELRPTPGSQVGLVACHRAEELTLKGYEG